MICRLDVLSLGRELALRCTPIVEDQRPGARRLREVARGLAVGVHRKDDCAAGVVVEQDTDLGAILRNTPNCRHTPCAHLGVSNASGLAASSLQALADVPYRRQVQIRVRKPFAGRREQRSEYPCLLTDHKRSISAVHPAPWATGCPGSTPENVSDSGPRCCAARHSTRPTPVVPGHLLTNHIGSGTIDVEVAPPGCGTEIIR